MASTVQTLTADDDSEIAWAAEGNLVNSTAGLGQIHKGIRTLTDELDKGSSKFPFFSFSYSHLTFCS
jgi:hypothetical protein